MNITELRQEQLIAVATPVAQWLQKHCHPHVKVIIEVDSIELTEGHFRAQVKIKGEKNDSKRNIEPTNPDDSVGKN